MSISNESLEEFSKIKSLNKRIRILTQYLNIKSSSSITSICSRIQNKDYLKFLYEQICQNLNNLHLPEKKKTKEEIKCFQRIKSLTKAHCLPHVWIGNTLADLLLPNHAIKNINGRIECHAIALEVDGSIHKNSQAKKNKDLYK